MSTKFNHFDFLEMFKRMLCIEDLSIQRTINKLYSLKNQRITKYKASSKNYQEIFHHLLRRHICDQRAVEILEESYVVEVSWKLINSKIYVLNKSSLDSFKAPQ